MFGDVKWNILLSEDEATQKWPFKTCTLCGYKSSEADILQGPKCSNCDARERTRTIPILMHYLQLVNKNWSEGEYLGFSMTNLEKHHVGPNYGQVYSVSLFGNYGDNHHSGVDIRDLSRFKEHRFCAIFSSLIFDYFVDHEVALQELSRVLNSGGVFMTHISNNRLTEGLDQPVEIATIRSSPGSFTYLGEKTIPSVKVGKEWFFNTIKCSGFTPGIIAIKDPLTEEYFFWFIGVKN